ncbi:PE-PPE domain-containing protein [Mycobacterium sp. CBMA293]|uniref:acyltransferase PE n=1 Tax=unclassified Mycolicibacterium TaxID=2636767 RepID=UPI0012DF4FAB|nr:MULTISPECIES: acyltransferase PE [unclassified Mycolicibacterium]MUL47851.1 PE-PPE domain-containing protein [Mycolicibacterium sp. CBMA 360]MUL59301.1 PE-PPE domain-containing protein [Mycolicibacterium sp. CBMA 335]MUL71026.1 PE-PPE domain-containing protein [Mycolicibacterium sp. CBMA 311]MUL94669.1 PE-PPE domain-containing protein [Mycolicibacterium sp. CBMA 230]MUM09153.1 PE-PPE domain-containing protein [Mycolicibacterium sp. CBMA 213]
MKKLLASSLAIVTTLITVGATGPFADWAASADEPSSGAGGDTIVPAIPPIGTPGRGYALGGAHVMGIPYDEYIRRTGADWFPGLKREIVDYPAGQVQGHVLGFIPGIDKLDAQLPGVGLDGPSIGESVDVGQGNVVNRVRDGGPGTVIGLSEGAMVVHAVQDRLAHDPSAPPPNELSFATYGDPLTVNPWTQSFLRQNFPVGSTVPALDFLMPPMVDSQYDTHQFISAYDSIADWPDRPDNLMALMNAVVGLATGHTAVAFTSPKNVPPQNIIQTVNSRGATTTTYLIPEQHLPLVVPFKYMGMSEADMNHLDAVMKPMIDSGYSRNDDPATAPVEVDPVHGYDPAAATAPATQAAFGGAADPVSQLMSGIDYVLSHGPSAH